MEQGDGSGGKHQKYRHGRGQGEGINVRGETYAAEMGGGAGQVTA